MRIRYKERMKMMGTHVERDGQELVWHKLAMPELRSPAALYAILSA